LRARQAYAPRPRLGHGAPSPTAAAGGHLLAILLSSIRSIQRHQLGPT